MIAVTRFFVCLIFFLTCFELKASPKRIISTSPVVTEFISFLGVEQKLVAVSNYCKTKRELPTIGSSFGLDYEKIITLKSDLLILESVNDTRVKSRLKKLKVDFLELRFLTLNDIKESSYKISKALNISSQKLDGLFDKLVPLNSTAKKVLLVIGETSSSEHIKTIRSVSGKSFYSDILNLVGGINILSDSKVSYPILDLEKILSLNPDIVIRIGQSKSRESVEEIWHKTIFKNRVKFMMDDSYLIPGPQVLRTYKKMRDIIRETK